VPSLNVHSYLVSEIRRFSALWALLSLGMVDTETLKSLLSPYTRNPDSILLMFPKQSYITNHLIASLSALRA
jgi:hypothetical protein